MIIYVFLFTHQWTMAIQNMNSVLDYTDHFIHHLVPIGLHSLVIIMLTVMMFYLFLFFRAIIITWYLITKHPKDELTLVNYCRTKTIKPLYHVIKHYFLLFILQFVIIIIL